MSSSGRQCTPPLECMPSVSNPNLGTYSFDNFFAAFLTLLQCITLEGWSDIMYYTQEASSFWAWPYFVLAIIIGNYFLVNLSLGVLINHFGKASTDAEVAHGGHGGGAGGGGGHADGTDGYLMTSETTHGPGASSSGAADGGHSSSGTPRAVTAQRSYIPWWRVAPASAGATASSMSLPTSKLLHEDSGSFYELPLTDPPAASSPAGSSSSSSPGRNDAPQRSDLAAAAAATTTGTALATSATATASASVASGKHHSAEEDGGGGDGPKAGWQRALDAVRAKLFLVVNSELFISLITAAIVLNTLVLCLEHYNMPASLSEFCFYANLVFSSIFIVELVLKVTAMGVKGYFADRLNMFDTLVVLFSIIEFSLGGTSESSGGGRLSVLRYFTIRLNMT